MRLYRQMPGYRAFAGGQGHVHGPGAEGGAALTVTVTVAPSTRVLTGRRRVSGPVRAGGGAGAPQVRQADPGGGWPPQVAHRVVAGAAGMPKMAASWSISQRAKRRCRSPRWPSAAHTVEGAVQPMSWPSWAWVQPLRWRRTRMFAAAMAHWAGGSLAAGPGCRWSP